MTDEQEEAGPAGDYAGRVAGKKRAKKAKEPLEFRNTLHALADGDVDASALVTGTVGLDGVATAFDDLGDPEQHAKILIDPASDATVPT